MECSSFNVIYNTYVDGTKFIINIGYKKEKDEG